MRKRPRVRALLIPLLAAGFVVAAQLPAFAPQAGAESAIEPLAVCRDGIRFLFFADYYPAGTADSSEDEAPFLEPDRCRGDQAESTWSSRGPT